MQASSHTRVYAHFHNRHHMHKNLFEYTPTHKPSHLVNWAEKSSVTARNKANNNNQAITAFSHTHTHTHTVPFRNGPKKQLLCKQKHA